jgi:hypothetical protein
MLVFNWKQPQPRKQVRFHCRELMTTDKPYSKETQARINGLSPH